MRVALEQVADCAPVGKGAEPTDRGDGSLHVGSNRRDARIGVDLSQHVSSGWSCASTRHTVPIVSLVRLMMWDESKPNSFIGRCWPARAMIYLPMSGLRAVMRDSRIVRRPKSSWVHPEQDHDLLPRQLGSPRHAPPSRTQAAD